MKNEKPKTKNQWQADNQLQKHTCTKKRKKMGLREGNFAKKMRILPKMEQRI